VFDGGVFSRQTKGIKAHGMKNIKSFIFLKRATTSPMA
jgi:hypothetical protein